MFFGAAEGLGVLLVDRLINHVPDTQGAVFCFPMVALLATALMHPDLDERLLDPDGTSHVCRFHLERDVGDSGITHKAKVLSDVAGAKRLLLEFSRSGCAVRSKLARSIAARHFLDTCVSWDCHCACYWAKN